MYSSFFKALIISMKITYYINIKWQILNCVNILIHTLEYFRVDIADLLGKYFANNARYAIRRKYHRYIFIAHFLYETNSSTTNLR